MPQKLRINLDDAGYSGHEILLKVACCLGFGDFFEFLYRYKNSGKNRRSFRSILDFWLAGSRLYVASVSHPQYDSDVLKKSKNHENHP